jgi:glycine/D-amino acid oxidase-like deaminating enzyme
MINTIVIGAGVMGASVAYRLAQAGTAVTVLEATRIGGGTSGISFAWTNARNKPPKTLPRSECRRSWARRSPTRS